MPVKLVLAAAISILASISAAVAAEPIRIGVVGPFANKSSADMGESIKGGARVFAEEANAIGGLLGRRVELVFKDDDAKPELGVKAAKELVGEDKVVAAVGYANTGVAIPAAKVFQEAKLPLIVTTSTGAEVVRQFAQAPVSYVFRIAASDSLQPVVLLNDLIDRRHLTAIAVLHDDTPYGQQGKANVLAELERRGLKPTAVESFKVGEMDLTDRLARVRDSGAQAILLYCLAADAANIARTAARMRLKLPLVGSWTLSHKSFLDQAGAAGEGARMAVTFIEHDLSQRGKAFGEAYRRINQVDRIPSSVAAAQTYDALRLLYVAIFQAGGTDPDAIRKALEDLKFPTESTVISRYRRLFTPTDHEAVSLNMVMMGEVRGGRVVHAYAEDANSALITRVKAAR